MKDERTGDDLVSIGFVIGLEYADATTSAHDLLQTFKLHPLVQKDPRGRRARRLGREGAAGRRLLVDAEALDAGRRDRRRRRRHGRHGGAQGRPPRINSGKLAAEAIYRGLKRGETSFESYEYVIEDSVTGRELYEVRNLRQPFQKGFLKGGPLVNLAIATKGKLPPGRLAWHRNDEKPMFIGNTQGSAIQDRTANTRSTSCRRSSSPATRRATTRRTTSACRSTCRARSRRRGSGCARPGVYEIPEDAPETGPVDVIVNYTNCVQCGAITAKGGRLTTPEGGDGPLYQIT